MQPKISNVTSQLSPSPPSIPSSPCISLPYQLSSLSPLSSPPSPPFLSLPFPLLSSPLFSLPLSPTSSPPSTALLCPAPCVMSLIHQPDSINRIPIAVCSLAARCCLRLYESITPSSNTYTLPMTVVCMCVCVCVCVCMCVCFSVCVNFKTSSALWPNLLQSFAWKSVQSTQEM